VSEDRDALAWADAQISAARDDPAARLALMERLFLGPTGRAPRHLPFRRAALSFMRWQAQRGLLNPRDAAPICEPRLRGLVRDGSPIYAWPYEQRHVWRAQHLPFPGRVLERVTRAR
jgi:hypothetical protein